MNKKPMNNVFVGVNLGFIFISLIVILAMLFDSELPKDVKIILCCIFLPIIIICSIILILDFILRRKYIKNKIPTIKEKEQEISASEWNYNQTLKFPGERTIYDTKIDNVLGEERNFVKKTDKYGNSVLVNTNNNIVDWIAFFIFGISLNIISITSFCIKKIPIIVLIIMLLIGTIINIYTLLQINRIRKLKLKINFFQILKLIFLLSLEMFIFGMFFIITVNFDISKIDLEKIIIFAGGFILLLGIFIFIYQTILIMWAKFIKK